MSWNNKNSAKGSSNQFELLDIEDNSIDDNIVGSTSAINATSSISATSMYSRPLQRTQLYNPEPLPRKRLVFAKAKATKTTRETNKDPLLLIEALHKHVKE